MRNLTTIVCALSLVSACALGVEEPPVDEGVVVLEDRDETGKSDTIFSKELRYVVRGDWWWLGEDEMSTDTEVLSQTDTTVRVRALRTIFDVPAGDELLDISVNAESFNDLGEISTDMAFLMMVPAGDGSWRPTNCWSKYFQRVLLDPINQQIDVVARTPWGDRARTHSFYDCNIPADVEQVAVFPFPSSNWGNMEGYYHVEIEATCGGFDCDAAQPR